MLDADAVVAGFTRNGDGFEPFALDIFMDEYEPCEAFPSSQLPGKVRGVCEDGIMGATLGG